LISGLTDDASCTHMNQDGIAACRRFPGRSVAIRNLTARDDGFRDMCVDLATAEAELQRWRTSGASDRDARIQEYLLLIEALTLEIAAALDASAIVPFRGR
jgi:hypothetical protein